MYVIKIPLVLIFSLSFSLVFSLIELSITFNTQRETRDEQREIEKMPIYYIITNYSNCLTSNSRFFDLKIS